MAIEFAGVVAALAISFTHRSFLAQKIKLNWSFEAGHCSENIKCDRDMRLLVDLLSAYGKNCSERSPYHRVYQAPPSRDLYENGHLPVSPDNAAISPA